MYAKGGNTVNVYCQCKKFVFSEKETAEHYS